MDGVTPTANGVHFGGNMLGTICVILYGVIGGSAVFLADKYLKVAKAGETAKAKKIEKLVKVGLLLLIPLFFGMCLWG